MSIDPGVIPIIIAGVANGSFVIPTKYIKNYTNEKIWILHSIIGMMIIPWLVLQFLNLNPFHIYASLNKNSLLFLIISGIIFGLGQICFACAIDLIGIALAFAINLGIGVAIGSIFVIFYKNAFLTINSYLVITAVFFIIFGLIMNYFARKDTTTSIINKNYKKGSGYAFLVGLASGLQNITFIVITSNTTQFNKLNSFWIWPLFLFVAAIPMIIGFLYKLKINNITTCNFQQNQMSLEKSPTVKNITLIVLMGLLFTGSLALYSSGMSNLPSKLQIIGWPFLMVSIILASQFWGWRYQEAIFYSSKNIIYNLSGVFLLLLSIVLLSFTL